MGALSIALDVIVLVCLGIAVFYVIRLTRSLEAFRETRKEFNAIMRQLSQNIDDARGGVENLKQASETFGGSLQKTINESKKMAGDLEKINKVSQSLVGQLESLDQGIFDMVGEEETRDVEAFAIFDRDYPDSEPDQEEEQEPVIASPQPAFSSQAERDLFDALERSRKLAGRRAA